MEERAAAYNRLAYCFLARPDETFMRTMVQMGTANPDAPWYGPFKAFEERIEEAGAETALQELAVDRTRLFKGLTSAGPTPPYQSLFRKEDRSNSLAHVKRLYRQAGFAGNPEVHDAPDQLGVELQFMAFLLSKQASEQNPEFPAMANTFFREDLEPFASAFAQVMLREAKTDFFRGYALLLESFIQEEAELVA